MHKSAGLSQQEKHVRPSEGAKKQPSLTSCYFQVFKARIKIGDEGYLVMKDMRELILRTCFEVTNMDRVARE